MSLVAAFRLGVGLAVGIGTTAAFGKEAVAAVFLISGIAIAISDWRSRRIPEAISLPTLLALAAGSFLVNGTVDGAIIIGWSLGVTLGFAATFVAATAIAGEEALGFGDVVVVALVSLTVTILRGSPVHAIVAILFGSVVGVVIESILGRRRNIPYGTWLVAGALPFVLPAFLSAR
jgi:leader peptidase (prepilin peptidase)/N-methyltransferase